MWRTLVVEPVLGRQHVVEQTVKELKVREEAMHANVPPEALLHDGAGLRRVRKVAGWAGLLVGGSGRNRRE